MRATFKHISHFLCLFLVLQIFALTVQASDMDDDGDDVFAIEQGTTVIHQQVHGEVFNEIYAHKHQRREQIIPEHRHNKKYQTGKHISVQIFISKPAECKFTDFYEAIVYIPAVAKNYRYMFFREINPPPPKEC